MSLPARTFERDNWLAGNLAIRLAMSDDVLKRFDQGVEVMRVLRDLGTPDEVVFSGDYGPEAEIRNQMGSTGYLSLAYHVDNWNDGFLFWRDWSWREYLVFTFSKEGKLVSKTLDGLW